MTHGTRGGWMRIGLVAAAWLGLPGALRAQCMQWNELSVSNPPPTSSFRPQMVYDKARHAATLLVGYHPSYPNRLLVYQQIGATWSLFNPFVPAPAGPLYASCYHEQRGTVLAWCGPGTTPELWEWDGAAWSRILHAGPWPGGFGGWMTYDPARHRVILVKDLVPTTWMHETWEWTGLTWEQGPSFGPVGLDAFCFDIFRNVGFLFGRTEEAPGGTPLEAYWEYTPGATAAQGSWARINESAHFGYYEEGTMAYDPYRRQILYRQGRQWSPPSYLSSTLYWDPAGPEWKWFDPISGPTIFPYEKRRSNSAMCFDTDTGQMVLFGGKRHEFPGIGTTWFLYNDTWVFDRSDPGLVVDLPPTKSWCAGQNGVLSISVAGSAEVQWWKNNQPIPGATSTILVVSPVTAASAGVYECEVGNACGAIWSRPCTVSVTVPPAIMSQPIGQDRCPGQDVLIVGPGVSGTNPEIKLQWDNFGFWMNVPYQYNPIGNFYILPNAQNNQSGWYRFEASNGCGVAHTDAFHIQIGVTIMGGPVSVECDPCVVHQFSLTAQGVGPTLAYAWQRDGVPLIDGGHISGATTPTLTINGVRYEDEGLYECKVTDACESRMSGGGWILMRTPKWVHKTSSGPHRRFPLSTDMAYDASRGVCVLYGGDTTPSGSGPLDDTWEWDGYAWTRRFPANNPGARSRHEMVYDSLRQRVLLFGGSSLASPYNSEVWQYDGSNWALLTTSPNGPPPGAGVNGEGAFDPVRDRVILTVSPSGSWNNETWEFDPVTLGWQRTNTGVGPYSSLSQIAWDESLGAVLSPNSWPWPGGTWRYTSPSWVPIPNADPPRPMPAIAFDTFRNRMTMYGCCRDTQSYGFYHTDTYGFDGTAWQLVLPEFHPTVADALWPTAMCFDSRRNAMVVIGNSYNTFVGSNPVETWEYQYADKVVFDRQPQDQPLVIGANAQFTALAGGAGTLTYQWRKGSTPLANDPTPGGSVVSGAQTNTLTISGLTGADAGAYRCEVSNACGSLLSDAADLGSTCYPDCNGNGSLTVSDFGCFQSKFVLGDPYADCNQSGAITVADFGCFQTRFVAGCP